VLQISAHAVANAPVAAIKAASISSAYAAACESKILG